MILPITIKIIRFFPYKVRDGSNLANFSGNRIT